MTAVYEDADTPDAVRGRDLMKDAGLLEELADDVNESLILPYDIPVVGAQCDEANAFWSPDEKKMTICYEDAAASLDIFTEYGDPDPAQSALNAEEATFYHELGHLVIDVYDLPTTGREEDVADQMAAFILLQPGEDGQVDPDSSEVVRDFARAFAASDDDEPGESDFADTHSLNQTRMYNLQCWIYGSDPDGNSDLVGDGALPQDRAESCEEEYDKLDQAWSELLDPHLR